MSKPNVSYQEKMAEAVSRMTQMGIYDRYIEEFQKTGTPQMCEGSLGGWYDIPSEDLKQIRAFEDEFNFLVFAVIRSQYEDIGTIDSLLFISDYPEEWTYDQNMLHENAVYAYAWNRTYPYCSDMGSIGFKTLSSGGLIRTF